MLPENKYYFLGYKLALPSNLEFQSISFERNGFSVKTSNGQVNLKACRKCLRLLTYDNFYCGKSPCKACHLIAVKKWQRANPEKAKASKKAYNKRYRYRRKLIECNLA